MTLNVFLWASEGRFKVVSRSFLAFTLSTLRVETPQVGSEIWIFLIMFYSTLWVLSLYSTATQNFPVGAFCWSRPQTREFYVGDTNMLVSKNTKICITPNAKYKIYITPMQNPNASQWNIVIYVALGPQRKIFALAM